MADATQRNATDALAAISAICESARGDATSVGQLRDLLAALDDGPDRITLRREVTIGIDLADAVDLHRDGDCNRVWRARASWGRHRTPLVATGPTIADALIALVARLHRPPV